MNRILSAVVVILASSALVSAQSVERPTDLNVAIFTYLPDGSAAAERLEEAFEAKHAAVDLDIELWNPYDDNLADDGLAQIVDFDLVEIDACRIDQLVGGAFGGLDPLPVEVVQSPSDYAGPAATLAAADAGKYLAPHWVCGNFLACQSSNTAAVNAKTFKSLLAAMDPGAQRPLFAAMWGRTTLGEIYADAMLDIYGLQRTRDHLIKLAGGAEDLDPKAKDAVVKLAAELLTEQRSELKHFDTHSYLLPRQFAQTPLAVMYGYSERLYYAERERQLAVGSELPTFKAADLEIRQFSFADQSNGTPCWVDGFVIPKGRLAPKRAAVAAFILFMHSPDAYAAFAEPSPYFAPSYLLPAVLATYSEAALLAKQPLLSKYQAALDSSFPIMDSVTWKGMRTAGEKLRTVLKP